LTRDLPHPPLILAATLSFNLHPRCSLLSLATTLRSSFHFPTQISMLLVGSSSLYTKRSRLLVQKHGAAWLPRNRNGHFNSNALMHTNAYIPSIGRRLRISTTRHPSMSHRSGSLMRPAKPSPPTCRLLRITSDASPIRFKWQSTKPQE
jgi:hypothetical protein